MLTIVLFVTKVVLFIQNKNKNWKLEHFLYFDIIDIKLSKPERAKHKRIQNALTISIVVLFIINIVMVALFAD